MTLGDQILIAGGLFLLLPLWLATRGPRLRAKARKLAARAAEERAALRASQPGPERNIIEHDVPDVPTVEEAPEPTPPTGTPTDNVGVVEAGKQRFQLQENRGDDGVWTRVRQIDRKGRQMGKESVQMGSLAQVARELVR